MFHVGQKVVCVDDSDYGEWKKLGLLVPRKGDVYTVRANVVSRNRGVPCPGLLLIEIVNRKHPEMRQEFNFRPTRFRPLTDIKYSASFTTGADPSTDKFDNRRKQKERV